MVTVGFLPPELKSLDRLVAQLLVLTVFRDERPLRGLSGLVDWRSCGMLSRFIARGHVTAERGEVVLFPTGERLQVFRGLIFGLGAADAFDERTYREVSERIARVAAGLGVQTVAMSLPGAQLSHLDPGAATELFAEAAGTSFSRITLVAAPDQRRAITEALQRRERDFEITSPAPAPQLLGGIP